MKLTLAFVLLTCTAFAQLRPDGATASFKGSLPPKPTADLSTEQQAAIEKRLAEVTARFQTVKKHERAADADIFLKAVRYALEFHEWYDKKPEDGIKKANALLDEAVKRIDLLKQDKTPWMEGSGQKVLGFYSKIDDSPQPYGVEVPEGLEFGKGKNPVPMWVWLHGRGDTATDLHFVYSRLMAKKPGQFQPKGTIVIHPFGRYCNGWKSAGETDVFEARDDATERFNIDQNRIALAGFSMGGAGAWHIGAHFADQWACVHTGAGFVDVQRYQKVTPEKLPPWYEQVLWGVYDVPDYALNFKNVPLISYSGENDSQRDSAEYMTEVFAKYGMSRPHLIGPGMGHKYHPEVIKDVQKLIEEAVAKGREPMPKKVVLQFRSQRYAKMHWVEVLRCKNPWDNTRVVAELTGDRIKIMTMNVMDLKFDLDVIGHKRRTIEIDGEIISKTPDNISTSAEPNMLTSKFGGWALAVDDGFIGMEDYPVKAGGTCIEDALLEGFTMVLPDGKGRSQQIDTWVKAESERFIKRWRSLMRGDPPVIPAALFHSMPRVEHRHVLLWGDDKSNSMITGAVTKVGWQHDKLVVGNRSFNPLTHIPVVAYPITGVFQREDGKRRFILNSGLTFREAHDKTNSLQNPKLPDWAILDITQPPNAESAGKVVAADFFDDHWQVIPRVVSPESREIPK